MTSDRSATREQVKTLFQRHAKELHGYFHRRGGADAHELVGEVFVVVLTRIDQLPEPDRRRAWLFGIARRLLLDRHRRESQRRMAEHEHAYLHDPGGYPHSPEPAAGADLVGAVSAALASLKEVDRELIRLTEWERLAIHEAAAVVELSPGAARVRLHRARRALMADPDLRRLLNAARTGA